MKKLNIAILWHFHQPFYKKRGEFILPWVRLHGVKDYKDLPELFFEFPNIKQTINIVPSMWMQLNEYISGDTQDRIQILTMKSPLELDQAEGKELLRMFVLCNQENMIAPYPDYKLLLDKIKITDFKNFTEQEIIDLQVWYNLTWIGYFSRQTPAAARLFKQGKNFSVADKQLVLDIHLEILSSIRTQLIRLRNLGQLEVSVSPFHHPILPLLCDTDSTLESMPNAKLPESKFEYPEDANYQVKTAMEYYEEIFGTVPSGMWPSEGSLSNKTLEILADNNLKWAASDELVLANSMKELYKDEYKYFPIKYNKDNREITLFFRDHNLSDAIGFQYSNWNPSDAAENFVERLRNIRQLIIDKCDESALDYAVVPIILDGENCWEYYKDNGVPFLRELFSKISDDEAIETVLFQDRVDMLNPYIPELKNVQAGSWINANFNIWAGHKDHRIAWSILADTRALIDKKRTGLDPTVIDEAMELIYTAEGSDWFWWYGDSHWAENKFDFDVLFRDYLVQIYELLLEPIPQVLMQPINQQLEQFVVKQAKKQIHIDINSDWVNDKIWREAACYNASSAMSSMHQIGEILQYLYFGNNSNELFIRIDLLESMVEGMSVDITFEFESQSIEINIKNSSLNIMGCQAKSIKYITDQNVHFISILFDNLMNDYSTIVRLKTSNNDAEIKYPEIKFEIRKTQI